MKHDELMPARPGRRSWTRPEDYLPPRRLRRTASGRSVTARPAQLGEEERGSDRMMLGLVPFLLLMFGLGVLAVTIAIAAWPGRQAVQPASKSAAQAEPGTAAPGWLERR